VPTREELFGYDVAIHGDVDPKQLPKPAQTFQDLADFVRVRGGGLLVVAGEQAVPHKLFGTPLADVLPVVAPDGAKGEGPKPTPEDAPLTAGYRPKVTPVGLTHPLFRFAGTDADAARVWAGLKPMLWAAGGYRRSGTAEVLAVHPDRPADGDAADGHPLVAQQFAGAGRVLFFGFDETWRWRFRAGEEHFNTFWRQAVRVLSRNRVARAELRTDRQAGYRRDDPITVTARFPDDAPPPEGGVTVQVDRGPLRNPDGSVGPGDSETQTLVLGKVEGSRATYQGVLTRTPEGEYRFRLGDAGPRAEVRVLPPPGERDRLDMNRADLQRAAAESRGRFYTLADCETLIDDLPETTRLPLDQPCPPVQLWNHAATFALLLLLLCNEWVLRIRERLL
jgi:hypothetical protein